LSETQLIDFIGKIDTPNLPPNSVQILEGDSSVLLRNIDTRSRLVKGQRYRAIQTTNRTVVFQFEDSEIGALKRIPMEETSKGMKFIRCQLPLRLIFAGTVHRSQGVTLQRPVIDYHTKFWEHGQLYVALSRVKRPVNLCILLPDDMDDFTIRPRVDLDVVRILEAMESSRALPIPHISHCDNVESDVGSIGASDATLANELPCPDDYL
jgi:ethanolamine utilization protein EutP (predicted NTPase)